MADYSDFFDLPALGERVRRARIERGMTQGDLAARLNVSQPTVSEWERGLVLPSKLKELFDALGLDADEIHAVARSKDPVIQAIVRQGKLTISQREALITVYESMLPADTDKTSTEEVSIREVFETVRRFRSNHPVYAAALDYASRQTNDPDTAHDFAQLYDRNNTDTDSQSKLERAWKKFRKDSQS